MVELGIDIETYSDLDITECGVHRYVESPSFKILLLSYSVNNSEVKTIDFATGRGAEYVDEFHSLYTDNTVLKTAFNAAFEIRCLDRFFNTESNLDEWECTMVKAGMLGYPMGLGACGKALNLSVEKDLKGKKLLKLFCTPNKDGSRNYPAKFMQQWNDFITYNIFDVKVEQAIREKIKWFNIPTREKKLWKLDQKINGYGVRLDLDFVKKAISINEQSEKELHNKFFELTGIEKPNSIKQISEWLRTESDIVFHSLDKDSVKNIIKNSNNDKVKTALKIRQELAKTSVNKFYAMDACVCSDFCARDQFQFYGANKTGRWAARLIQVQNLTWTKTPFDDLDKILTQLRIGRDLIKTGEIDSVKLLENNAKNFLSNHIRTSFIPRENNAFLVSDFSAIEARVTAWFAGEEWRLEVFRGDGKIYEASASQMFNVPIELCGKGTEYRKKGKIAELALGYQGSVNAMINMGGFEMGLTEEDMKSIVDLWRKTNRKIVKLWYDIEACAIDAVKNSGKIVKVNNKISFVYKNGYLFCNLPSGRSISYVNPFIKINKFDKECIAYYGLDTNHQWNKQETYGGKFLENIVQGTARDLLGYAMLNLNNESFDIVLHIHDEVVLDVPINESEKLLKRAGEILSQTPPWAEGLPLEADSFLTPFYIKT